MVLVDTSALLALLVPSDAAHTAAKRTFARLKAREIPLMTTSYVLVETYALLGRRFGLDHVLKFRTELEPLMRIVWIDGQLHGLALDMLLSRRKAKLSLVDAASIIIARERGVDEIFAFDRHFQSEGLRIST